MSNTIVCHGDKWYLMEQTSEDVVLTPLDPERAYPSTDKTDKASTVKQNASLHKYCATVSAVLNDGGFSIQKVVALFKKAAIEWTMLSVKDIIWRNIQIALTKKKSTTALDTEEVSKVYRAVDHYLSGTVGIRQIDFPSIDSMIRQQQAKEQK